MERYYYLIESPAVKKILQSNLRKRKEGLQRALEFAKEHGFEIGTSDDCCYKNINIVILSVPENLKQYFKWNGRFYVPKGNSKCAKEWRGKIDAIQIHLEYPFRTIREETKNDVNFAIENNRLFFPRCVFLMGKFYLIVPVNEENADKGLIVHENYKPIKKWEWEKLLDEAKAKEGEVKK